MFTIILGLQGDSVVKNLPVMQETQVQFLGWEEPLEKEMAMQFNILARRIPWIEEPGGLQSIASQRVGHDWSDLAAAAAVAKQCAILTKWSNMLKTVYILDTMT